MSIARIKIDEHRAIERAIEALRIDGILVVEQLLDASFLGHLKQRMDEDTLRLLRYCQSIGGNPRRQGQLQQGAPPFPPYLDRDLLAHPFVWAIIRQTLGFAACLIFYNGNTNCPGSAPQDVHLDQDHKGELAAALSCLVISVPPQKTSVANGAIEVWPGTHAIVAPRLPGAEQLELRRRQRPPLQIETELGDVIVRDARVWHRAVSNPSTEFRHLLGAVYHSEPKGPITFDHRARPIVDGLKLNPNVLYADLSEDYLFGPTRWLRSARDENAARSDVGARPMTEL